MKKIYLICPVRFCDEKTRAEMDGYVAGLEAQGHQVHYPPRDVCQTDDGIGLDICEAHADAMEEADEVHVWWVPESRGSHFDFGMAYAIRRLRHLPIVLANKFPRAPMKSYTNVLKEIAVNGPESDI